MIARIEAARPGLDIRFVFANLIGTSPRVIYESLHCARGQAENRIKLHKAQLASDRTSCRRAVANQVRLVLHTAAYWLMLFVRETIPAARDLARAEFATLRLRLLKITVRVQESASRIRPAFASCCPDTDLVRRLAGALALQPRAASPRAPGPPSPQSCHSVAANASPTFQTSPW